MTAEAILIPVRPCIKCGASDRYSTGACKACAKINGMMWYAANQKRKAATGAAWRAENTERDKTNMSAWRKANKERNKSINSIWTAANKERIKTTNAAWRAENLEAMRIHLQNRRARQRENGGVLSKGLADKLFKLQKGKCACCKQPLGNDYHLDHIFPIALGGTNTDDNMQLLRKRCNLQKQAKHPVDFMQSRGLLL